MTTTRAASSDCGRHYWFWSAILIAAVAVVFIVRYTTPIKDGDIWFHLLYGQYFVENHTMIPDHTIYSWTPSSNDTIYCTWLGSSLIYLLHKFTGLTGLFIFRYLCMSVIVIGCIFFARKHKLLANPLTWLICLNAVIMSNNAAFLKPEILSFVLMTISAWNWYHIRSSGESAWRNVYLFPLIMLIWVNTHGGFVFGATFFFLLGLGELLNTWLAPYNVLPHKVRKHLLIAFPLSALAVVCTPYGIAYPLQLAVELFPNAANMKLINTVSAYTPTFLIRDYTLRFVLAANLSIFIFIVLAFCRFRRLEWSTLLANLFFAWLYTRFLRTTYFWAPIVLFSFLYLISNQRRPAPAGRLKKTLFCLLLPLAVTTTGVYVAWDIVSHYGRYSTNRGLHLSLGYSSPFTEADYIKKNYPHVKIGNTYDQGAYLLYKLWPENKVFIDARQFPYKDWYMEYFAFSRGKNLDQMLKKYPADLWCIGHTFERLQFALLWKKEWKLAFYGDNAAVIVRSDIPLPVDNQVASERLFHLQNLPIAKKIIRFAVSIGDYQTADKMLASFAGRFHTDKQKIIIDYYKDFIAGLKAYRKHDYEKTKTHLMRIPIDDFAVRYILSNCFLFLSAENWQNNELLPARRNAGKALFFIAKDNPYALYNYAIADWYMEQHPELVKEEKKKRNTTKEGDEAQAHLWQTSLREFIQKFGKNKKISRELSIAKQILAGRFKGAKPDFLLPEEPVFKKLLPEEEPTDK